jgi:hypothetical protein
LAFASPTAISLITRAAAMSCSRNDGDTFSTFATLSKPSLSSSFGSA